MGMLCSAPADTQSDTTVLDHQKKMEIQQNVI